MYYEDVEPFVEHMKKQMELERKANPDKVFVVDSDFNGPWDLVKNGEVLKTYKSVEWATRIARNMNKLAGIK